MKAILVIMAAVMLAGCSAMVSDFSALTDRTEETNAATFRIGEPWNGSGTTNAEKPEEAVEETAVPEAPAVEEAEKQEESAEAITEETKAVETVIEEKAVAVEEPVQPEIPSEPELPVEEQVKEDQESVPEPAIIEEEKETVLLENDSLKISLADDVYTITDSGETVEIKKENALGFYMPVDNGNVYVFFNGIDNKLYYMEAGKDGVPLE